MKILYFTATGNSLYVAKEIGGELLSIPQLIRNGQYEIEDDVVGIVFPTYYGDLPEIVEEYLSFVDIKSNYLFAIATFGNTPSFVLNRICKLLIRNEIQVNYTNGIRMVNNNVRWCDMDFEKQNKSSSYINNEIIRIKEDIENRVDNRYTTTDIGYKSPKKYRRKLFVNNDTCNKCNLCTMLCPNFNIYIDVDDNQVKFFEECNPCLACLHACPQNSIFIPAQRSLSHYINPKIKLGEIIRSNRQV